MVTKGFTRLHRSVVQQIATSLHYLATKEDDMEPEDFDKLSDAEKFAHIKSLIIDLGPAYYERIHQGLKSIYDAEEVAQSAPDDDKDDEFEVVNEGTPCPGDEAAASVDPNAHQDAT